MVSFYRLSQRRIPALIAILSILLLFIAPDVSKTLEHQRNSATDAPVSASHLSMAMHDMDMSGMTMEDMSMMHSPPSPAAETLPADHSQHPAMQGSMGMMDDFACGYCQLLVHFPLMLSLCIPLVWLLFLLTSQVSPSRYSPWFPSVFFPGLSQPRAPPFS